MAKEYKVTVHQSVPWVADAAAYIALVAAAAGFVIVVFAEFVWPLILPLTAGPCGQTPTDACFSAHPDFYRGLTPGGGGYSTPASRAYGILIPVFLAAAPLTLASVVIGMLALALRTRRRRAAILGVIFGSVSVALIAFQWLTFLVAGGS